ncbi:hypothetical protein BOX15_Mlig003731g1 [Macrostomum lignano]|uniref:Uncharacterized protein n=2 Tax=Macrostomum lignano TaxID=282301 RepID=A0A267DWH6_9PLAT|nr:hypothetical protein BOX15_Mlig003731g3 [Macrostomum lignano]PAA69375.1 hypothetical protein BOX15_Mlig003731g1 [Macrostomum lignano]
MCSILEDTISTEDLERCQLQYEKESEKPSNPEALEAAQFAYAWGLSRTRHRPSLRLACQLLQSLFLGTKDETAKRDYLYYIAVAKVKLAEYEDAFEYIDGILKVEPNNHQVRQLRQEAEKQRKRDGTVGVAILGGAAAIVGVGAAVGAAIGIAKLARR